MNFRDTGADPTSDMEKQRRRTFASPDALRAEFDRAFSLPDNTDRPPSSAYVSVRVAARNFALRADEVRGARTSVPLTRVPSANRFLIGLANLSGEVMPVCDLRRLVHETPLPSTVERAAGIVVLRSQSTPVAIACDEVVGLEWAPDSALHGNTVALREGAIPLLKSADLLPQIFDVPAAI